MGHQGIGDAGVSLLSQQDGLSQLIQDHGVPIYLLLSCLQLGGEETEIWLLIKDKHKVLDEKRPENSWD